ncbi:alpha-glucan phosphorylase [Gemmatirosa kalamazoonensis]|uniref:glycogen phosphorylase n=1 Tax=Gemmatirosa kalamazoonensis TaxID=861299 RepID=W0RKR3_9BACT|nr:alpha-glucan family phosphorylase [Gemmatirosa kalamazoonensis]AHG91346.1 alpha-glucan phosphorylase [Gemmatirosa kalamazoonensis]
MATGSIPAVAYFSMEICLEEAIPTYSGGLGVLAGDTLRSAADLGAPIVGVTLAHRKGYFRQHLDADGVQTESAWNWNPETRLPPVPHAVTVEVEGRPVRVRAWRYDIRGVSDHVVPVYLLDTDLPENSDYDRSLTDTLYGGDNRYRLCQEVVLGMGGAALLAALDHDGQYHINEGHAALLCLWLLDRRLAERGASVSEVGVDDVEAVERRCIFTTHTPVPAGHDRFPMALVREVLGERAALLDSAGLWEGEELNMTRLALRCSRFINGVALRHQEVSQEMFPEFPIGAITNGVHATTWTSAPFRDLFDRHIPQWRRDNQYLRYALTIPLDDIREAHAAAKQAMLDEVARRTGQTLDPKVFTIGFARRSTPYKRADLIFSDLDRLRSIVRHVGPVQIVFGGKAHPRDEAGKFLIRRVHEAAHALGDALRVVYVENYEMQLGHLLTSGSDVWLNNPMKPLEASGTSGMKAALNGVPSLSVLDGWWIEGCLEGTTGWAIGPDAKLPQDPSQDIPELYYQLERVVLPLYYGLPYRYAEVMRNAIAINGSFFNTQRMVSQYIQNAYAPGGSSPALLTASR